MGGIVISRYGKGKNPDDALAKIREADALEYGNDYYNGSAINAQVGQKIDYDDEDEFIQQAINGKIGSEKNTLHYCVHTKSITNKNKVKSMVTNSPQKGTRKWVTMYEVVEFAGSFQHIDNKIGSWRSQTVAIKKAREA